jgi:hypothetical protein
LKNTFRYFTTPGGLHLDRGEYERFRLSVRQAIRDILNLGEGEQLKRDDFMKVASFINADLGTKSAGYPYMCKKGEAFELYGKEIEKRVGYFRNMSYPEGDSCINLLHCRTYKKGKMRTVFGVPLEVIIVEMSYFNPIIRRIRHMNLQNNS